MKNCSNCSKEKDLSHYIDKRNGKETSMCSHCRNVLNNCRKRSSVYTTYKKYKDNMGLCELCGLDAPVKDFDHTGDEEKICRVMDCKTEIDMEYEREKCRVLCRKCHVKITSDTRSRKQVSTDRRKQNKYDRINRNIAYVKNIKVQLGGCQNTECDDIFDPTNLSFYEFDHIDYKTKKNSVSNMAGSTHSIESIQKEIDKCILLCSYCHNSKTEIQRLTKKHHLSNLDKPLPKQKKKTLKRLTKDVDIQYSFKRFLIVIFITSLFYNVAESSFLAPQTVWISLLFAIFYYKGNLE